jgi:fumarate reductase subunit C
MVYFIVYGAIVHALLAIKNSISVRHHMDFYEGIKSPVNIFITFIIMAVFMAPIGTYFKKVPKYLEIDFEKNKIYIKKEKKF